MKIENEHEHALVKEKYQQTLSYSLFRYKQTLYYYRGDNKKMQRGKVMQCL